jgi:hypothetical protein
VMPMGTHPSIAVATGQMVINPVRTIHRNASP